MIQGARKKSMSGRFSIWFVCVAVAIPLFFVVKSYWRGASNPPDAQANAPSAANDVVPFVNLDQRFSFTHHVMDGDVLSDIFSGHEIPFSEIVNLESANLDGFTFTHVQPGKDVYFSVFEEGSDMRLKEVAYQVDSNFVVHAKQTSSGWILDKERIPYEIRMAHSEGVVDTSLYVSALQQGVDEKVVLQFADAFAWDIDFPRETRGGDQYLAAYEEKYLNGERVGTGKVLAAQYINQGVPFQAYYYEVEPGKAGYFDASGRSLQKAFLKAPVNFRYVSSGFSQARFHPTFGKVMPHYGVDYAANYGVPIISVADGVVSKMGWMGAYGNRIEVRHSERYTSGYSHMSAFVTGMHVGDRIKQGQVVGYVGSTGASTGNHVHFSMTEYGNYVDPSLVDVPDGDPVPEDKQEDFLQAVQKMKEFLQL